MREYKPVYALSFLVFSLEMLIGFLFMGVSMDILSVCQSGASFGHVFGIMLQVGFVLVAFCSLLMLVINIVARPFSRKRAVLTEFTLEYEGKTLQLHDIRYITLYLPELSKHNSKPQVLTVWADNKHYVDIQRPSIELIAQLKKNCPYAAFDVDDWKGRLRNRLIACLVIAAITPLLLLLDPEHKS